MAIIKFDPELVKKTNKVDTCLFEGNGVTLKVSFYWDSHGRLIPWEGGPKNKKTFSRKTADVRIIKKEYTMMETDWEDWVLYVDKELFNGNIRSYRYNPENNTLTVKMTVGWG
jgi:hypothetical protein